MEVFLPQQTLSAIRGKNIFIDTCILLDFASLKKCDREKFFETILKPLSKNSCSLITIDAVKYEFLLGTETKSDLSIKENYLKQLIENEVPIRTIQSSIFEELIMEYGVYARGTVSYTDLCLAAAIKHYKGTYLLTRNYRDFPLKIFSCKGIFVLHFNNDVRTYCFYEYGKTKSEESSGRIKTPF